MIRFFAAHPTFSNLLMILLLLSGILVGPQLLRETFPRSDPSRVEITVPYPGARPEDVETAICERIENALDAVTALDTQSCEAREGLAKAVARMNEGDDFQAFVADVKSQVETITDFPDRAETLRVKPLGLTDFVVSVSITGPLARTDLKNYAEDVRTRMLRWGGIPIVSVKGFSTRELRVGLNVEALRKFGLSVSDVARSIQATSIDVPSGTLETRGETLLVRVDEERRNVQSLADLIIRSAPNGGQVRLGEVAQITEGFALEDDQITFDGKLAAVLDVSKTRAEDALRVIDAVSAFVEYERTQVPEGIVLELTSDAASVVRDRLQLVVINGLQGLGLVFLVLWAFFGFRFSFWVAMGLPVSFMGGVFLMWMVGYSLNLMTTLGLLIVIGLLMDDAIVIAENIVRLREKGRTPMQAASEGAAQVFPNVLASFATTAMIFGSLAFLSGDLGAILRVVPVVMLFVLTISLIEAFWILPHHLVHTLENRHKPKGIPAHVNNALFWVRENMVGPLVDFAIRFRYVTAGLAVALLLSSVGMLAGGYLKFVAFPELDGDTIVARVLLPQGTPLARTQSIVARLEEGLRKTDEELSPLQPDGAKLIQHVSVFYGENRDAFESGAHVATVSVDLLPSADRVSRPDDIMALWRQNVGELPDIISLKYAESTIGPAGIAIDMRLKGDNLENLKAASLELQNWISSYQGVTSILDDLRPGKREMQIQLSDAAAPMGITAAMVADQLRAAYFGTMVSEMQVQGQLLEVTALLAEDDRSSLSKFDDFVITRTDGSYVPLSVIANIKVGQGYSRINREDGMRTVTVQGTIDTRIANASAIVSDTLERFMPGLLERFPDVSLNVEGQRAEAVKTQQSMLQGFLIGLFGVFLLLSFLFRSYVEPIVVMLIIPLSLSGVIYGHMFMGLDFSMPSMLGFVALAGVVVNNSILLVDFVKHEHGNAVSVAVAAAKAARARFRAIFLTSLTTIVGLLPILTETSLQAQILIPLVTSLVFGLFTSGIMVLTVLPAIYAILDDMGLSTLAKERRQAADQ
ncbi:Cation/multidrug efflux pump [hydrothermal vent metagenome]|uniref:Cation/multidrug efflux pump n=1 Tax=hydrothermal vent metagenome TaxID=652676 RepID=A0A3B0UVP0_9ZZZZ